MLVGNQYRGELIPKLAYKLWRSIEHLIKLVTPTRGVRGLLRLMHSLLFIVQ